MEEDRRSSRVVWCTATEKEYKRKKTRAGQSFIQKFQQGLLVWK